MPPPEKPPQIKKMRREKEGKNRRGKEWKRGGKIKEKEKETKKRRVIGKREDLYSMVT